MVYGVGYVVVRNKSYDCFFILVIVDKLFCVCICICMGFVNNLWKL